MRHLEASISSHFSNLGFSYLKRVLI
uniref:Uncharacterized protein n=1 Tax=Rhizophora mucronata TaxID=61149 RepID=A0A2P2P2G2_RHIMU